MTAPEGLPDAPPELLPGPSAWLWIRRQVFGSLGVLIFAPIMVVGSLLDAQLRHVVVPVGFGGLLVFGIWGGYSSLKSIPAIRRENAAGYTTLKGRQYVRFWRLDPKSGLVVRRPVEMTADALPPRRPLADRDDESEGQSVEQWFLSRGFTVTISEEDGEFWLALGRDGEIVAPRYGRGHSRTEAAGRAKQRYLEEQ
jgi:hypothetical protein